MTKRPAARPPRYVKEIIERLDRMERRLVMLGGAVALDAEMELNMQEAIQDLRDELKANTDATDATVKLVKTLLDRIAAAPTLDEVRSITAEFHKNTKTLVDAALTDTAADPNA